jgi:hypothetical protein
MPDLYGLQSRLTDRTTISDGRRGRHQEVRVPYAITYGCGVDLMGLQPCTSWFTLVLKWVRDGTFEPEPPAAST